MKAIIIHATPKPGIGYFEPRDLTCGLEELQAIVGGYIEHLDARLCEAYVNEEGKMKGLPENPCATFLFQDCHEFRPGLHPYDYIAGPAILVGLCDEDGAHTDLSPEVETHLRRYFPEFYPES